MNRGQLERLLRLVARTEEDELSCSACFDLLPHYVDLASVDTQNRPVVDT